MNELSYIQTRLKQGKHPNNMTILSTSYTRTEKTCPKEVLLMTSGKELMSHSYKNGHGIHPEI